MLFQNRDDQRRHRVASPTTPTPFSMDGHSISHAFAFAASHTYTHHTEVHNLTSSTARYMAATHHRASGMFLPHPSIPQSLVLIGGMSTSGAIFCFVCSLVSPCSPCSPCILCTPSPPPLVPFFRGLKSGVFEGRDRGVHGIWRRIGWEGMYYFYFLLQWDGLGGEGREEDSGFVPFV